MAREKTNTIHPIKAVDVALKLTGTMQNYAWGHDSYIADLQGRDPSGDPEAELWFGAHPSAPSETSQGPLDSVIARDPQAQLGYDGTLPFLVKLLAAAKPLSLQAHPSLEQAGAGFERDNAAGIPLDAPHRNYKDANHKPELLIALTPFRAMAGFRPVAETIELLDAFDLPELAPLEDALARDDVEESERLAHALTLAMKCDATSSVEKRAGELAEREDFIGEAARNLAVSRASTPVTAGSSPRCCSTTSASTQARRSSSVREISTPTCMDWVWR